jgi:hypothetical protein
LYQQTAAGSAQTASEPHQRETSEDDDVVDAEFEVKS